MPKTEASLYRRIIDINRNACHHRGLTSNYGYDAILDVSLVDLCLALRRRFAPPIRILDVGCGDGCALDQLRRRLLRSGVAEGDLEFWGMGLNRYDEMSIAAERFIESGLNAYHHEGPGFHLIVSVFTFHYLWHKLEGVEKIHRMLVDGGVACLHFPGYLVRYGESVESRDQNEVEGNRRFAEFVSRLEREGAVCPLNYRLVPCVSDDDDRALLAEFGNLRFVKRPGEALAFGQALRAFSLFTTGFRFARMNSGSLAYVASHYVSVDAGRPRDVAANRLPTYCISAVSSESEGRPVHMDVAVHPAASDTVILVCPGAGEPLEGRVVDTLSTAERMCLQGLGAVVRYNDPYLRDEDYPTRLLDHVRCAVTFTLATAPNFCATSSPRLCVMAYSSSGGAMAAVAADYPGVDTLLLVAPSFDVPRETILPGLRRFRGRLCVLVGERDRVVLPQQAFWFYEQAVHARSREYVEVPDCGHEFRRPSHRAIFEDAPQWAFAGRRPPGFPGPVGEPAAVD